MDLELRTGEKLSVMIVDDEEDIRETLRMFLDILNLFTFIIEAHDGADALQKCANQSFDLIITDLMMPKVKGIEFVESFKQRERKDKRKNTPIILLSANITGEEVQRAMAYGVKYALTKPCTADDFTTKVKEVLFKERREKLKLLK